MGCVQSEWNNDENHEIGEMGARRGGGWGEGVEYGLLGNMVHLESNS